MKESFFFPLDLNNLQAQFGTITVSAGSINYIIPLHRATCTQYGMESVH